MTAMGVDPAGGGADAAAIAWRNGGWFAPIVSIEGKDTADGSAMAARIIQCRKNRCPVVIDAGGGYGGAIVQRLADNGIAASPFNGAGASKEVTRDAARLQFINKRAEAWWRLREALNPDQEGGAEIALPQDDELKADLASVHWELTARGIQIEHKDDIRKRIGRSPNKGDAVALAWSEGGKAARRAANAGRPIQVEGAGGYNPISGRYNG